MFTKLPNPTSWAIPPKEAKASNAFYQLDDTHYAKVVLQLASQTMEKAVLQRTAYEVDAQGNFIVDGLGHPVSTDTLSSELSVANVRALQATLEPGWLRYAPEPRVNLDNTTTVQPISSTDLPPDWLSGHGPPDVGNVAGTDGQHYCDLDSSKMYIYDMGELERLRHQSCHELFQSLGANLLF